MGKLNLLIWLIIAMFHLRVQWISSDVVTEIIKHCLTNLASPLLMIFSI
jgi:hypothetical protein